MFVFGPSKIIENAGIIMPILSISAKVPTKTIINKKIKDLLCLKLKFNQNNFKTDKFIFSC